MGRHGRGERQRENERGESERGLVPLGPGYPGEWLSNP